MRSGLDLWIISALCSGSATPRALKREAFQIGPKGFVYIFDTMLLSSHVERVSVSHMSSSRSVVVVWSVCSSVWKFCENLTFRVSNGNCNPPKTFLPTYLLTYVTEVTELTVVTVVTVVTIVSKKLFISTKKLFWQEKKEEEKLKKKIYTYI